MDSQKVIIAVAVVAVAVGGAWFFWSGSVGNIEGEVRKAFGAFTTARGAGNKNMVAMYVSKKFADAGMNYKDAVGEFSRKREGYSTEINNLNLRENQAEVSYTRKEIKDGKPALTPINNEIWVKERDGQWRLFRLAAADRMRIIKERKKRREEEERILEDKLAAGMKADDVEKIKFYRSDNKRDPFESLIAEFVMEGAEGVVVGKTLCDPDRPREFLENFELLSLKLVGVVFARGTFALVETPNGNGYTVRNGMYLGRHCGKVVKITRERVVLSESYYTPRAVFKKRRMELKLRQEES
jgi:Tfp pilus assembly protein PilP